MNRLTVIFLTCFWFSFLAAADDVRQPFLAGSFYPKDKAALEEQIKQYLDNVKEPRIKGRLIALIVPHAGYEFSGRTAACAYIELLDRKIRRVVLIGVSHRVHFDGISVAEYDRIATPLGDLKVDREFAAKMIESSPKMGFVRQGHEEDNSLEVQYPFLKAVLPEGVEVVPVMLGGRSFRNCQILAISLAQLIDDETVIICSTDWSHYHDYETARAMDLTALGAVVNGDTFNFASMIDSRSVEACGASAVITTMMLAPTLGANNVKLLKYENSGDLLLGDKSRVVGYAALAYYYEPVSLSKEDRQELLMIARRSVEDHLAGKKLSEIKAVEGGLAEKRGAFVTLTKKGRLRGCIGYIQAVKPLAEAVQEMAVAAAVRDSRFPPVTEDELSDIDIEISVLSRLERVRDVAEIEIGRDGLYILRSFNSGLLLPQVATDNKWGREEFLENVCYKADLEKDAWRDDNATLYRFTADVFHE